MDKIKGQRKNKINEKQVGSHILSFYFPFLFRFFHKSDNKRFEKINTFERKKTIIFFVFVFFFF